MHRGRRRSIWTNGILSVGACSLLGLAVSLGCTAFFSLFILLAMDDFSLGDVFAVVSSSGGVYTASYVCGKYRRRRGIAEGMTCGIVIYIVLSTASAICGGAFVNIKMLLRLALVGAVGGVSGVNSKRPKGLRD